MSDTTVEVDAHTQLILVNPSAETVEVINSGPQALVVDPAKSPIQVINAGPPGPPGRPGLDGADGQDADATETTSLIFESPGAVTTWNISHPFDHDPSVEIRDSTHRVCLAPISFSPGEVHIDISPSNISLQVKLTP